MPNKRKPLGSRLPAVKAVAAPTDDELNAINHQWDELVPEWAGLLDPKPQGTTPASKFYRDEATGQVTRARDGLVITLAIRREAMALYTERMRGK